MKTNKYILTLALAICCAVGNLYAITSSYYSTIDGKKESGLRDALTTITSAGPTGMSYDKLWTAYKTTDVYPTGHANAGKIWDMYGNCTFTYSTNQCGNYTGECVCYNREHSLPKSWFGEATPAYYDLGHIVPTDGKVNGMRSNYAFGEVNNASYSYAGSKLGSAKSITTTNTICGASVTATCSDKVFEPVDEYKGDFARMYMYMVVRYKTMNMAQKDGGAYMFNTEDTYYRFTQYSVALLMKWHRQDPVSQKEIDRNNGMQTVQGNRNPFIDYPCLAEYLWGDKAGQTVTLSSLVGTFDGTWTTGDGCPCGTDPAITLPATDIYVGATTANTSVTKTVTVQGVNLTGNISLAVSGTNSSFFTLNATSMLKANAEAGSSLTITYRPTSAGNHTATLTISSGGLASARTYTLTGTCCTPYNVTLSRNGITETMSVCGTYTLPTAEEESNACGDWAFKGWLASGTSFTEGTTTAPTFVTEVSSATTLHAVYGQGSGSGGATNLISYDGTGGRSGLTNITGVSQSGLGNDYASSNSPYLLKFDDTGDYIQFELSSVPSSLSFDYKMLGGGNTSTMTIQECATADGTYADVEALSISGNQNSTGTLTTSKTFSKKNIRMKFTKGSNVGVGAITITGGGGTTTYKKLPCTTYTISLGSVSHGTIEASAASATEGTVITLDADPDEGYKFGSWTVTKAGGGTVTVTDNQFSMPDKNVTVTATFTAVSKYDIRFYNNGNQIGSTQKVYEGSTPNVPADPEGCDGYTFVGWWTTSLPTDNTTAQTWVTDFTVTGAQDYYAVFEHVVTSGGGGAGGTVTILPTSSGVPSSYAAEAECTIGSYKYGIKQMYLNNSTMQWRASTNSAGAGYLYNKSTYPGKISSVVITYNSSDANKNFVVNVGSSANPTSGTSITPTTSDNVYTFNCSSSNADYFVMTNGTGAGYVNKIEINYGGSGSSTTYYTSTTNCAAACTKLDAPTNVTATPGDEQITLSWSAVTGATGYTVSISKGSGYTTECGSAVTSPVTVTGTSHTFTGLINDLEYTTTVIANASSSTCNSDEVNETATPIGCLPWANPTFTYSTPLTTGGGKVAPTIGSGYGTPTFMSSNTSVLQVDEDGKVTPVSAGTATITAHWPGDGTHCPKDVVSNTITVKGIVVLTFNANYEGADPATKTQNFTYGEAQNLTSDPFSRTGYTFQGWATSPNGDKVYDNGASITITAATTLYAVWQANKHKVEFDQPDNGGTFTVNSSSNSPVNNVDFGSMVTIAITPTNSHFTVGTVSVTGKSTSTSVAVSGSGNTRTFTMPDENVTVTVTMTEETKYTVNWYVAGTPTAELNYAGVALAGITDPSIECNGKVFVGWTATANYNNDAAPGDLFTDASTKTMPSNNTTNYYAVFAEETTTSVPSSSEWTRITNISQLTDGATVMLVQYYYDKAINNTPGATDCIANAEITNTTANLRWTAVKSGNKWKFKTSANKYLSTSATANNTTLELDATYNEWTITADDGGGTGSDKTYTNTNCFRLNNGSDLEYYNSTFKLYAWSLKYSAAYPFYIYIPKMVEGTGYSGYTTSCVAPSTVTVTFNANYGDTPTTKTQDVSYNSATALDANTFTREGYSFAGWATSASGAKVYNDKQSVTLTKNTTLYALWTKNSYNVTFSTPTGATAVTVNGQSSSPQSVEYGATVTVAVTPAITHTIGSVTAGSAVVTENGNNTYSFTMPASDVTVTVTMNAKPTYTIRFFNNGTQVGTDQTVVQGQQAVKPSDPTPCDEDYTFVGWWTATLAEDNEDVKTWITNFTATKDQDYYAAYSYSDGEGGGSSNVVFNFGYANDWGQGSSWSGSDKNSVTATKDGVTVTHTRGTGSMYANATATRFYKDNTLTFEVSGSTITSIVFTCSQYQTDITSDVGTCTATSSEFSWSGSASSVSFSRPSNASSYAQFTAATIAVGGGSTTYYTTAPTCEACANMVNLTKGTPTNGTFTLDKDNGEYENCKSKGFVVTVSDITPAEDYEFDAITQTGIAEGVTIDQDAKTVTYAQNVNGTSTINVTFKHKPQYTIRFYDNGALISEQLITVNKSATKPADPEGCDGYAFVGWWTAELEDTNTSAPTYVTSFTATQNQDYHAVFRHVEEGDGGGVSKTYTLTLTGSNFVQSYNERSFSADANEDGGTGTFSVSFTSNGVMKSSNTGNPIQLRKSGNTAGILYNTTDLGTINSITFGEESTNNIASTYKGSTEQPSSDGTGGYFKITNGSSVSYLTSITINFTVSEGGSSTTYYTTGTDCRDCSVPTLEFAASTVNKFDGDASFTNKLTVTGNTMGAMVSYKSSNVSKAEVNNDGVVTIHDATSDEPITITATLAKVDDGVKCQKKVTATYTLNIYNKVTWLVNGTPCEGSSFTTQTTEGGEITAAPADPEGGDVCFGKAFVGWTTAEYEESDVAPEVLYTAADLVGKHITANTTYYAVFANLTGSLNVYKKGTSAQLASGTRLVIVNTANNKALKAETGSPINGTGITVSPDGTKFTSTETAILWTVQQSDDGGYYFMCGDKYLNASSSALYCDGDEDAWKLTGAGPYVITSGKSSSYSLEYYNGAFKMYSTGSGDAFNMDFYFPDWTIDAYATTCGLCLPRPEVQTVIIKQDQATITWKSVPDATGYEVICSGGTVTVKGTTATITDLTPLSDYTYSIRATGGEPYTCFRTTRGDFSTPDCDDMPYDITATPYNVTQAIIRWKAEAERGKVIVYTDEACTSVFATIADTISPCTVTGLAENTRYYFKVFAGATQECASPVQTFLTQTTAVELVEWTSDGVIILLTGDETTATLLVEDKQEKTDVETNVATGLFFSKYYEAAGNVKLWAIYNGTNAKISLEKVKVQVSSNGAQWGRNSSGAEETKATTSLAELGHKETGWIHPGEEIIVYNGGNSDNDAAVISCMAEKYGSGYSTNPDSLWYEIKNNTTSFSGDDGLILLNGTDTLDVIGVMSPDYFTVGSGKSAKNHSIGTTNNPNGDDYGWCCDNGTDADGNTISLSTNRCILVRKNTVKDGLNAVAKNRTNFATLCEEWWGAGVPKGGDQTQVSCDNFTYVGHYDYQEYYASYDTATVVENLERNEDGTIFIPVDSLDKMSCSLMRINVYNKTTMEQMASREYRIPIMIQEGEVKTTNDLFTKHDAPACKECDVLVFSGATLKKDNTKEDRDEIHDLTIYPGGTLELPAGAGDYTVNTITYRVEGDNAPVTNLNGNLITNAKQMIVTKRIKNDRYYFISLPYNCAMADVSLTNGYRAVNGKDFRLMEYDGEARAKEGSLQGAPGHWKLMTGDTIYAGQGYAIAVNTTAMKEIVFPMTLPKKNITEQERTKQTNKVTIEKYVGQARNTNHNWNLIAHPYITKFEVTADAANVEALWENPSRENTGWIDDWKTWEEEDPTQSPDTTGTHTGNIVMNGTLENGIDWVLYEDGSMELTGGGQMVDFSALDAVPWAVNRQLIKSVKIGGDVQKIGKYAFGQCTNLTNVIIAAPVTNLASQAFAGCTGLRTFRIESTQYVSATTTTFDGISSLTMISLYVPQSMYNQYNQNTPWNKMAISAFDDGSTTGGDGTNTHNPSPRRAVKEEDHSTWKESPGGIYVTIPAVDKGKVIYNQKWIEDVPDIQPFTAVFIQGDGTGEITFTMPPSDPESGSGGGEAPKRNKNVARNETKDYTIFVGVTLTGNSTGKHDLASLRLRPDFGEHYKFNLDLLKFTVFNTERPQLYFKTPNDQLAFRAISDSLAKYSWIPMGVYCRDAGTYTFSLYDRYVLDEVEAVYLHDNETGTTTNLLFGNYTIETTKQLYTNTRFSLNVLLRREKKVDVPTFVEQVENPNAPHKFIRDGVMYIMRDGKIYDLTGKPAELDKLMLNR